MAPGRVGLGGAAAPNLAYLNLAYLNPPYAHQAHAHQAHAHQAPLSLADQRRSYPQGHDAAPKLSALAVTHG